MKLGILGLSPGNGHPYSWSAIFNGFDATEMSKCPFPVIPDYLSKQRYPDDFLTGHQVTHVWTQDPEVSAHVAAAARIATVVSAPQDMIGHVDAVLLARDDAQSHFALAAPFLAAGLPIYIDKPLAVSTVGAQRLLDEQRYDWQIFSCSALRYAPELVPSEAEFTALGELRFLDATTPKYWDTYAVHIVEPVVAKMGVLQPSGVHTQTTSTLQALSFRDQRQIDYRFTALPGAAAPLQLRWIGSEGSWQSGPFSSFACFRSALQEFIRGVETQTQRIPRAETLNVVSLLELGR